jgi:hypothetical protein
LHIVVVFVALEIGRHEDQHNDLDEVINRPLMVGESRFGGSDQGMTPMQHLFPTTKIENQPRINGQHGTNNIRKLHGYPFNGEKELKISTTINYWFRKASKVKQAVQNDNLK